MPSLQIVVGSRTLLLVIVLGSQYKVAVQPCCLEVVKKLSASGMPGASASILVHATLTKASGTKARAAAL